MSPLSKETNAINKLLQEADELCEEGQWEDALMVYRQGLQIRPHSMACRAGARRSYYAIKNGIKGLEKIDARKYEHRKQEISCNKTNIDVNALSVLSSNDQNKKSLVEDKHYQRAEFKELCKDIKFIKKTTENIYFPKGRGTDDMIEHFNVLMDKKRKWSKLTPEILKGKETFTMSRLDLAEKERWNRNLEKLESITDSNTLLTTATDYLNTLERANIFDLDKFPIKGKLCYIILKAHIDLENFDDATKFVDLTNELAEATDDEELKLRANYQEGRSQAMRGNYSAAAKIWKNLILMTTNPDRLAHLHHEVGRCYFKEDKIDSSRVQGVMSLEEARKANNDVWIKNAAILIAQTEVLRGYKKDALEYYEIAEAAARRLKDQRSLFSIICEISKLGKEPRRPKVESTVTKTGESVLKKSMPKILLRRPKISTYNFTDASVLNKKINLKT